MGECTSCGTEIDYRDKFCSSCGAFTAIGRPVAQQIGQAVAQIAEAASKLAGEFAAFVRDEANRKPVIIGSCVLALLLLALTDNPISKGISGLFDDEAQAPQYTADGRPDFASYEDVFLGEDTGLVITGTANVRNYPTSDGTTIIRTLKEGDTISAREVQAFDPESAWYKLSDGGYIWGGNIDRYDEPSFAQGSISGTWSDRASCFGHEPDTLMTITDSGLQIGGTRSTFLEMAAPNIYVFEEAGASGSANAMYVTADSSGVMLWLRYGSDLTGKKDLYLPSDTDCDEVMALGH